MNIFTMPDDGFLKKPKHVAINYTVKYQSYFPVYFVFLIFVASISALRTAQSPTRRIPGACPSNVKRPFQTKVVEKIKTRILFPITFSRKSWRL
jgi:hypothetical protein